MSVTRPRVLCVLPADGDERPAAALRAADRPFTVETAASAAEGLARLEDSPPDCVASECRLPDMEGLEFLQSARERAPETPFVLCVDGDSDIDTTEALDAGADDCLRTSSESELLATRVWNAVQARKRERESDRQAELMRLAETAGDTGGFELDPETGDITITAGVRRLTGIAGGERRSLAEVLELFSPADRREFRQAIDRAVETGEQVRGTWRYRPVDGDEQRRMEVTLAPAGDGQTVRGAVRDVTERSECQHELEQVETLFEHAQDGLFLVDVGAEFTVERTNDAYEEMAGLPAEEIHDQTTAEVLGDPQTVSTEEVYRECIERRDPVEYSDTLRLDGELTHWQIHLAPVVTGDTVEYVVGSTRNITEQKQQQQQLQRLQQAIDGASVAMTLSDPTRENNPLVYVNDAFEEMTGYTEAEALGRSRRFLKSENNDPERMEKLREALSAEEPVTVELRTTRKDGTEFWTRLTVSPIHDDDGRLVRTLWTQEDITERKQRERELETQRRFIEQALDALDDLFYVLDEDGAIQRWNEQALAVTGYTESELAEMHALELFPDAHTERVADAVERVLTEDQATMDAVEAELLTADGDRIPYEFTGGRLTDTEGNVTGLVGVGRDVTERRQRERRFRALVENSNDIISIIDAETGRLTYQSPSVEQILGYDPDETVGDIVWDYIHPDDRDRTVATLDAWLNDPETAPDTVEYRAQHADGSWRWMEAQGNDQRGTDSVEGYVVNCRDVTDRRERQQQLTLLNRVLRHNLRNDLNVMLGAADTIRSRASGPVANSAEQILQKGGELLQTAEVEREIIGLLREQPEYRELALEPLLGQIASTVGSTYPDAVIDIDCPDGATVQATRELGKALRELVTNAVVHNDDESPTVTVTVEQRADTTHIQVADTGPRIPEMERNVLLGRGERTPLYHGTGLGLWFVELAVSRSGGTITFAENSPTGNVVGIELS